MAKIRIKDMNKLEQLGTKYGTDKGTKHNYLPAYYELFKDRRKSVKKVCEVGVGEGASLRMWREFFPNAMIYGGEIQDDRIFKEDRIEVLSCDQSFEVDLADLIAYTGPDIDLFVDDGSHLSQDQLFTCLTVMPWLNKEVIYVIEDVVDTSLAGHIREYSVETVNCGRRYDDRLLIIRHKHG